METYLKLKFLNSNGKSSFIRISNPKKDLTTDTVGTAMELICSTKAFEKGDTDMYEKALGAKYVTTTENVIFDNKPET